MTGKVKWFNAEKGFGLSSVKMATMYSYISQLSNLKASKRLKKVKKLNSKLSKETVDHKQLTFLTYNS